MTLYEALSIVYEQGQQMACPHGDYPDGIYFDKIHGWMWASGRKAGLPTPVLLFGEWEVRELTLNPQYNPQFQEIKQGLGSLAQAVIQHPRPKPQGPNRAAPYVVGSKT